MHTLKIAEAITASGLPEPEVAVHLFPAHRHPGMALTRVLKGEGDLSSTQVSKLALLAGVPVEAIYKGGDWLKTGHPHGVRFTRGEYTAELDTKTWITSIYRNSDLKHESVIHSGTTALSVYIAALEDIINNL